jgi:hypothetical protein
MCLIYEALEAITTSLMMTSAVAYSAQLSTPSTLATIQGMVGGTYYGIGLTILMDLYSHQPKILKHFYFMLS